MFPTKEEAWRLLNEGGAMNPGPWTAHSRVAAECAGKIALKSGMDAEKAYILGLLHDIGRRFGPSGLRHATDGCRFLKSLGFDEAAKICLTHSFAVRDLNMYIGRNDIPQEEYRALGYFLAGCEYNDYDRLIQLCDSIAMAEGPVDLKTRMDDVETRYGYYPAEKRAAHFRLKAYFEEKMGMDLYDAVGARQ